MPLFVYRCSNCTYEDELFSGRPRKPFQCDRVAFRKRCRGRMERVPTAAALKFEGAGWARDGYSSAGKKK